MNYQSYALVESNQSKSKGSESRTGDSQGTNHLDGQPNVVIRTAGIKSIDEAVKEEEDDEE